MSTYGLSLIDRIFKKPRPRLTIFGRSLVLIISEIIANAVCWIVASILFGLKEDTRDILSLAMLAWTLGLRHGLDADHISAIDNATRGLISLGQLPVTCGLFFSLGHSTIVIVVNVAIAISTDVYDRIGGVSTVGGIVGAAVSGSFLFIIGVANSIILWRIIRDRRRAAQRRNAAAINSGESIDDPDSGHNHHNKTVMMRILGPITTFVDRPWKMYPVGVLFGFGFDTASSIALLAISAIAKRDTEGRQSIRHGDIVILPLLFTAGMTLVDSADSVLMLYSYAGAPEGGKGFTVFERLKLTEAEVADVEARSSRSPSATQPAIPRQHSSPSIRAQSEPHGCEPGHPLPSTHLRGSATCDQPEDGPVKSGIDPFPGVEAENERTVRMKRSLRVKKNTMSGLSIVLTLVSILVAFSISLITIMGLIGENCGRCREAAEAEDGGGPAGRWWRGWAKANDKSGIIGATIVGCFLALVLGYYGIRWIAHKRRSLSTHDPQDGWQS